VVDAAGHSETMTARMLFVHGAGGYLDDKPLADGISSVLGLERDMPEFADDDMSFEGWATPLRRKLDELGPDDRVVAHSFGATVLVRVLAEKPRRLRSAVLLAMPDWSPRGWDVPGYALGSTEPETVLSLHHCRDDDVVPFEHLARNAALLPSARTTVHATGGHQFLGAEADIAADIR
jgi:predicted alpha/beta hydrolase family esterase